MASSMVLISLPLLLQTLLLTTTNANPIHEISPKTQTQFQNRAQNPNFPTTSNPTPNSLTPNPSLISTDGSSKPTTLSKFQFQILRTKKVVVTPNSTISSKNRTFSLGFFSTIEPNWYLGIWYASIPTPTVVWVANRDRPIKNYNSSSFEIAQNGRLVIKDSRGSVVWSSTNAETGTAVELWENGNLVLLTHRGTVSWQSFDYPTDTWLPGMNLTSERGLTSWRSPFDPSPGLYSLRLRPPEYGEFELLFNGTRVYWTTGNWTGQGFTNVPEMLVPYIYRFHFVDPFKPTASFGFTEGPLDNGLDPPLTRFQMDYSGQLRQYTWATQTWDMFWFQPENKCRVFGLCGAFGVCNSEAVIPCECPSGFEPVDKSRWESGDYSGGCHRSNDVPCEGRVDGFDKVGVVSTEGAQVKPFNTDWDRCQKWCMDACSCIGLNYNDMTSVCTLLWGSLLNMRNLSSDNTAADVVYLKVQKGVLKHKKPLNPIILSASIVGSIAILVFVLVVVVVLMRRREKRNEVKEEGVFPVLNLKVFSYKDLHAATQGFSEKLGHGGFGAVFQGELSDSTLVAVKRLERPGSGEKEFRAEVCTIGNIQHVNLVRLRGFCSENSHRLLVYDYMPNGPLSLYLRRNGPNLSWDVRFRLAVGTARGIAYLHEECRDCIIHCDIKPENILLDSDYTAKVSDFGLAKLLGRDFSRVLATMRGTWGYVAPEWISGVAITTKADVYSYGMTLIELLGGRRNVESPPSAGGREGGSETTDRWFFPPWAAERIIEGNVRAVLDERLSFTYNIEEAERVALVAVWCIQDDEAMRPTMGKVVKMLEGVVEVTVPSAPKLLQALVSGESFCGVKADSGNVVSNGSDFSGSDFSGYNTIVSSCSELPLGNASSLVNENVHDNQRSSVGITDQG